MGRRLILLLDGTWNDMDFSVRDTNIVRLRSIIGSSLNVNATLPRNKTALDVANNETIVAGRTHKGVEHLVCYQRGVGTGTFLDRIFGGALGDGLEKHVREAYKFLSFYYLPGDEIFIFGFSRGSYTARSLVGLIGAAGLLRAKFCTPELEQKVWDFYRTEPNDRSPGIWSELTPFVHDRDNFRISCVGVFDTVGALGAPLSWMQRANRERYQFHDVTLSAIAKVNLHALAVDEHRAPFRASVWRKPQFKDYASIIEQAWFTGAHSDVGGGYITYEERNKKTALDDMPLDWMIGRLRKYFPDFPVEAWARPQPWPINAPRHEARGLSYKIFPFALRAIANNPKTHYFRHPYSAAVGYDRHDIPIGESIHVSVLERMAKHREGLRRYRPLNLMSIIDRARETYQGLAAFDPHEALPIVDWNGEILNAADDLQRNRAVGLLDAALKGPPLLSRRSSIHNTPPAAPDGPPIVDNSNAPRTPAADKVFAEA
jgi:hypothetical protein